MSTKIAMRAKLTEHQECTGCHCHSKEGYMIKSDSLTRFVCEECYRELAGEYPLSNFTVSINREALAKLIPEDRKPSFKAGYFLGKREGDADDYSVTVTECIESSHPGRGTVDFFSIDDVMTIRKKAEKVAFLLLESSEQVQVVALISIFGQQDGRRYALRCCLCCYWCH